MISFFVRYIKRFAVLIPGIFMTYLSVRGIFPSLERQLPLGWAVLVTYVLGAYVLIPAVIRLIRILWPPKHPPTYSVTPDGFASDPVNIGIVATRAQLEAAMTKAGWAIADSHSIWNVSREISALLSGRLYKNAPMSHLYLLGRKQDIGFEIQTNGLRGQRHHVRFWATRYDADRPLHNQSVSRKVRRPNTDLPVLWLGAASRDVGYALIRHNVQLTHMIHPDTDKERDLIVRTLSEAGQVASVDAIRINEPYRLVNRAWRGYLEADGIVAICHIKA